MLKLDCITITQDDFTLKADLEVATGRRVAVIGPSGAGKSTLLGAIAGFVPLSAGRILYDGNDLARVTPGKRPMTMLFQDNNLFPHLTLDQNVGLGLRPDLRLGAADRARVTEALDRVGLAGYGDAVPGRLSGGQQSRAALARILVQNKPLILLDEPFSALGPALRNDMLDLVRELVTEAGASLLMVTHAPEDVRRIAQDVIFVDRGIASAPQDAMSLMENPTPELKDYLG